MIQFTASQAEKYREYINKTAVNLTDDEAAYVQMMFEYWQASTGYDAGKKSYNFIWRI